MAKFMQDQAVPKAKAAYVPSATFFPVMQQAKHVRTSYSTQPDEAMVKGITDLGRLLKLELAGGRS